jgi:2'-hydroxyisoflavone reductase
VVMQTLVLGETAWLGGHVASAALEREHQVTCLARGFSGVVPEGVELVRADRSRPAAYDALKHQQWDVVVDVARQPGQVRSAVRALADRAGVMSLSPLATCTPTTAPRARMSRPRYCRR